MPLKLEALPAQHGDSLLLHYGPENDPQIIIIDGGPKGVYASSLRPRLAELKDERSPDDPMPVRLVMVSHIDEDHILGILNLCDELSDSSGQRLIAVQELWHNAFSDIVGDEDDLYLKSASGAAKVSSTGDVLVQLDVHPRTEAIIASVPQGKRLRETAKKLGWILNDERPLMMAGTGNDTIDAGGELKLTILGPSRERLIALQKDWMKKVKEAQKKAEESGAQTVEYKDTSPPNLASMIVLATDGKRRILLTGDGRGDYILEGIENAGLMEDDKFPVDVLKVPHHGSIRDLDTDFFERIPANDYIISANGRFSNPDIPTLEMIVAVRGNEPYNIHLTYPVDQFNAAYDRQRLQELIDESQHKSYKIIPRDPSATSIVV
ncbi:MAG TPA: hypothetical protein VNN25_02685 [Thermoanaerobaculia bacterium]|nr:hypothetical protein [Thermoanaerobaculia bacterium]